MSKRLEERLDRVEAILKENSLGMPVPNSGFREQVKEILKDPLLPYRLEEWIKEWGCPADDVEAFARDSEKYILKMLGNYFIRERQYKKAQEAYLLLQEKSSDVEDIATAYLLANVAYILNSYMDGRPFQVLQQLEQMMDKVVSTSRSLRDEALIDIQTYVYIVEIRNNFKKGIREMHNS